MEYIAILGRLPSLSLAELERMYGASALTPLSATACLIRDTAPNVQQLGGITKTGRVALRIRSNSWNEVSKEIVRAYVDTWRNNDGKQTLGISVYDWNISPRDIQKMGLAIKSSLKRHGVNVRLIPNAESILNTATSHHNKLGLSPTKSELIIIKSKHTVVVAESTGAQNITALARRDQGRPKRDAFVGMLPPKLALTMVNLSGVQRISSAKPPAASFSETSAAQNTSDSAPRATRGGAAPAYTILDPFCGTGVILQEAALRGFNVYGTDLSEKMIDYSKINLDWLAETHNTSPNVLLQQQDAITANWQSPIDAVATETYLGQPFSAPPAPDKLIKVRRITNDIISGFLTNLAPQIASGTPLCVAVPAWRDTSGQFSHLPLIENIGALGYLRVSLVHATEQDLIYYRDDQVVARQLLILTRK